MVQCAVGEYFKSITNTATYSDHSAGVTDRRRRLHDNACDVQWYRRSDDVALSTTSHAPVRW